MSAMHTPGPWRLEGAWDKRQVEYEYLDAGENRHAGNICVVDGKRGELNDANARLIAAAPDLLEALETCREVLAESAGESFGQLRDLSDTELGRLWVAAHDKASAAIKKAVKGRP